MSFAAAVLLIVVSWVAAAAAVVQLIVAAVAVLTLPSVVLLTLLHQRSCCCSCSCSAFVKGIGSANCCRQLFMQQSEVVLLTVAGSNPADLCSSRVVGSNLLSCGPDDFEACSC
jgi:hypothetical protein